jgi:D-serine dehydratase
MTDYRVSQGDVQEDQVTAAIEKVTAQVPSSAYLGLAIGAIAVSIGFQAAKKQHEALFIGQWVAPFLLLGIYNKLVKLHGSDGASHA